MSIPVPPSPSTPMQDANGNTNAAWDQWFNTLQQAFNNAGGSILQTNAGGTGAASYTNGQLLIGNTTGNTLSVGTITGGTNVTVTNGPGTITISFAIAGGLSTASGGTGQVTYTDGQLLIGDSSNSSLDKATLTAGTGVNIINGHGTITVGLGTVASANGGTGVSSPTAHTLPVGEGASAMAFLGPLTNGQVLIGSTGADPVVANILDDATTINVLNGAGTIRIRQIGASRLPLLYYAVTGIKQTLLTSGTGTFTPDSAGVGAIVELSGGGGGGAGPADGSSTTTFGAGGGGGGGSYLSFYAFQQLSGGYNPNTWGWVYTVGAGGTAGTFNANGGNGGNTTMTTFAHTQIAGGGGGGSTGSSLSDIIIATGTSAGGSQGVPAFTSDLQTTQLRTFNGQSGEPSLMVGLSTLSTTGFAASGAGGASGIGIPGGAKQIIATTGGLNGNNASTYGGGGGGGGLQWANKTTYSGGTGGSGYILITEFISK